MALSVLADRFNLRTASQSRIDFSSTPNSINLPAKSNSTSEPFLSFLCFFDGSIDGSLMVMGERRSGVG